MVALVLIGIGNSMVDVNAETIVQRLVPDEVLGGGESFGETALLRDVPRTATVAAVTDLTLRTIERRLFLPAVTGHADASQQAELVVGRFADMS